MSDEMRGFSIPFRIGPHGGVVQATGAEKLKENLIHILLTDIGERVMRREYGGGIRRLVHDPNNAALLAVVQRQIAKSIGQWEPRVLLQSVTVTQQNGALVAEIHYVIRSTRQPQSLSASIGLGGV